MERFTGLLPPLSTDEYEALKADIAERGCDTPIVIDADTGDLLDGYHRRKIGREIGAEIPERRVKLATDAERAAFALSHNLNRRHLSFEQRQAIRERQQAVYFDLRDEYTQAQAAAKVGATRSTAANWDAERTSDVRPDKASKPKPKKRDKRTKITAGEAAEIAARVEGDESQEQIAADFGISQQRISQITSRARKAAEREAKRKANEQKIAAAADVRELRETFATIVIDPPWDFGDEGDVDQFGRGRPTYATLTAEQVAELPIAEIAAADAHLYLWITNRSLPKGFALLEAWGFRYITCLTWVKPSFGMGNYFRGSTEQVLFGVRGSLPLGRKDAPTHFTAPRGPDGHSSKPDAFYDLVRTCSPAPRIDYFGRREHDGFTTYGEDGLAA